MSQAPTTPPSRNIVVTLLGVLTLLWGLAIMAFFIYGIAFFNDWLNLLMKGVNVAANQDPKATQEQKEAIENFFASFRNLINVFFGIFAFIGLIGFIGGIGVTFRIGRVLAIIFALINALIGGGALNQGLKATPPHSLNEMIVPIAILAYGVITFFVLLFVGKEFRRGAA